jgi:hypothetical protein
LENETGKWKLKDGASTLPLATLSFRGTGSG